MMEWILYLGWHKGEPQEVPKAGNGEERHSYRNFRKSIVLVTPWFWFSDPPSLWYFCYSSHRRHMHCFKETTWISAVKPSWLDQPLPAGTAALLQLVQCSFFSAHHQLLPAAKTHHPYSWVGLYYAPGKRTWGMTLKLILQFKKSL